MAMRAPLALAPVVEPPRLQRVADYCIGRFTAMASPCEVLVASADEPLAAELCALAQSEALRIQNKFSRYQKGSVISRINASAGNILSTDAETAALLDYAAHCFALSDGLFDITSGVLRRAWRFDGSENLPEAAQVAALLPLVGWGKVMWEKNRIRLLVGMEIDFGGIGKEYAVDRAALLLTQRLQERGAEGVAFVINFGGDLFANAPRAPGVPWRVGIEDPQIQEAPRADGEGQGWAGTAQLQRGGLATSGDARRFLLKDGLRYSHILNPRTGYPEPGAPRSVSVAAATCLEAGTLSTLAMLQGTNARTWLKEQEADFWLVE